jgi:hypothetical protein
MRFFKFLNFGKKEKKFQPDVAVKTEKLVSPNASTLKTKFDFPTSPVSKRSFEENSLVWQGGFLSDYSWRTKFYRFLKDNIPALNSAIWTWTKLCSSPTYFQIKGSQKKEILDSAQRVIADLDKRIYENSFQKFGGMEALLSLFFNSLFVDGCVCGELVLSPSGDKLDKFYFIDPSSLVFQLKNNSDWELYQNVDGRLTKLNQHTTYYFGLDADVSDPRGKSIFGSIPFVSRIEQRLVEDMQKTMHNAGYHRLHIKIKPPQRAAIESDETYISRANKYFDDTVEMIKNLNPEDNPITWDDVEISYIGPSGQLSSSTAWYVNHKAIIEDICAGVHLDPIMLGYSYGLPYNWALFKYDLVMRNVMSLQRIAKNFVDWIRNIELSLQGFDLECEHHFDNRKTFGMLEKRQAEKVSIKNILLKQKAGLISETETKQEIANM